MGLIFSTGWSLSKTVRLDLIFAPPASLFPHQLHEKKKCSSFWTRLYQLHSEGWSSWYCLFFDMQLCLPASRQTIKFLSASAPDRLFSFGSISLKFYFKLFHTTFVLVITVNAVGMQSSVVPYSAHCFLQDGNAVFSKSLHLLQALLYSRGANCSQTMPRISAVLFCT